MRLFAAGLHSFSIEIESSGGYSKRPRYRIVNTGDDITPANATDQHVTLEASVVAALDLWE